MLYWASEELLGAAEFCKLTEGLRDDAVLVHISFTGLSCHPKAYAESIGRSAFTFRHIKILNSKVGNVYGLQKKTIQSHHK